MVWVDDTQARHSVSDHSSHLYSTGGNVLPYFRIPGVLQRFAACYLVVACMQMWSVHKLLDQSSRVMVSLNLHFILWSFSVPIVDSLDG